MKKQLLLILTLFVCNVLNAQGRIELSKASRGVEIEKSTFEGVKSTFSFRSIESERVNTEAGEFSVISMGGTIPGGDYGAPSLPISRELVAVPFGATPVVRVLSYSVNDYDLGDYGISKIFPQQPSFSKSAKPEEMKFHYDESAYQTRSLADAPKTSMQTLGTMRGVNVAALQVEPVSYNPSGNILRVFNDIEIEITFENADRDLTEKILIDTYSPYFDVIYKQLFNARTISDFYDEHPDLLTAPVNMLVVANRMFEDVMQPWIEWKTQKGFYLDVKYTDEIGTSSDEIQEYVKQQYAAKAPSFLILFGDEGQLAPSLTSGYDTQQVTDNYYACVDDDYIPDMYCSRMCCETVDEMEALIEKVLQYEQYTMPDPSYLENVLLIAGWDYFENSKVLQPTVQYLSNYYYNAEHGYTGVHEYLDSPYTNCYNHLNTGVGHAYYTAHGLETCWDTPRLAVSDVNSLTNINKYFWAIGNCCLSGDWGYDLSKSLGEAMICADKKGAWGYIGSCPVTWWWEDYFFAVGANNVTYKMPEYDETTIGCYDALWSDSYNVLSAVMYSGNLAVSYSHLNGYPSSTTSRYYYEAYHTLGDGSVMPYRAKPSANEVSHLYTLPVGAESFMVKAAPGSYVGISADGVLYGAGMIDDSGTGNIPLAEVPEGKDVTIVVSHPDCYPYIENITSSTIDGPYIVMDTYQIVDDNGQLDNGESVGLSVDMINIGNEAADNLEIELRTDSEYVTLKGNAATIQSLPAGEKTTLNEGLSFEVASDVPNKTKIDFKLVITSGTQSWECDFSMAAYAPQLSISDLEIVKEGTEIEPGETVTIRYKVKNDGGSTAYDMITQLYCASADIDMADAVFTKDMLEQGDVMNVSADITVPSTVPAGSMYQIGIDATSGFYAVSKTFELYVGSVIEDFETGSFASFDWVTEGDANWVVSTSEAFQGYYSAKSGNVSGIGSTSTLKITVDVLFDDEVSFYRTMNSPDFDEFRFYIDGEQKDVWSGVLMWERCVYQLPKGTHVLEWEFKKSSAGSSANNAYVDYVKFPPTTVVLLLDPVKDLNAKVENNAVLLSWSGSADEYVIQRNGEEIATTTETNYTDVLSEEAVYVYSVTAKYGEEYASPATITVDFTIDIEEMKEHKIAIYPNPTTGTLYVEGDTDVDVTVYNYQGRLVMRHNDGTNRIDISALVPGVYFLEIRKDEYVIIEKIILQ